MIARRGLSRPLPRWRAARGWRCFRSTAHMAQCRRNAGRSTKLVSASDGRSRWRLISSRPKWLIWPTWMRARSIFSASLRRRSTIALCLRASMSMKSMTIRPARSRRRSWRATSSAASRLVRSAVSSMPRSRVAAAGVHVDGDQRLGLVDHQIAAGSSCTVGDSIRRAALPPGTWRTAAGWRGAAVAAPQLHLLGVARHQHAHEVVRRLPALLAVDQHLVDVARIDVADGALDQRGFLVDQRRGHRTQRDARGCRPTAASGIRSRA